MSQRNDMLSPSIAVIGCGSLGTAIVQGLLSAPSPKVKPSKIEATVTSEASAKSLRETLQKLSTQVEIKVSHGDNVSAVKNSDVIILACPPHFLKTVLGESGMYEAFQGKLLISVLAGVTTQNIEDVILKGVSWQSNRRCWIARALPNLAVAQNASATAIENFNSDFPEDKAELVNTILQQLGGIVHLPASIMDASTVVCGSTPAFIALFLDGLIDGAVAAGVPRVKADAMIAQVLGSTAALLADGQRASTLRESICAMPGCTIKGNIALEEGGTRGVAAKSMKIAIEAASKLG